MNMNDNGHAHPVAPPHANGTAMIALAEALMAAWNAHDPRRVAEFFSEDFEGDDIGLACPVFGRRGIRRLVAFTFLGLPDVSFALTQVVAQGDQLVMVWRARGTHLGKIMNIPPTRRVIEYQGVTIYTVREGLIVRSLRLWDMAGMLRQIGLLPELVEL